MEKITIPLVSASARDGRKSLEVARALHVLLSARENIEAPFIDVTEYVRDAKTTPPWGEGGADSVVTVWSRVMKDADGLIIVSPEYNRGYPGELKILLDSLYTEYARKPVGLCGVSDGPWGGTRMIEELRLVCAGLGAVSVPVSLPIALVDEALRQEGGFAREGDLKRAEAFITEVLWYARALKGSRGTLKA